MNDELIERLGRSELLGLFRPLLNNPSIRDVLGEFLQFHAIVDTNIIASDLLFLTKRRRQKDAQPAIKELLTAKTIIGYFPREALNEVPDKCAEFSERYGIPIDALLDEWRRYQLLLCVVPTAHIGAGIPELKELRDLTDAPFIQARRVVGAQGVITEDKDIGAASIPVIPKARVLLDLRDYSRHRAVRVAVVIGTGTAVIVPVAAVVGLIKMIRVVAQKAPRGLLLGLGIVLVLALLHPKSREFLVNSAKAVVKSITDCAEVLGPTLTKALAAASQADARAVQLREKVEREIDSRIKSVRPTLSQAVYRACLLSPVPMAIPEVWNAVSGAGVRIRAQDPLKSVGIALRRHPLLVRGADERWVVRPVAG